MLLNISVVAAEAAAGSRYFDFVTHYAVTTLSMGTVADTFCGDAEPPVFRAWTNRVMELLRLVKA